MPTLKELDRMIGHAYKAGKDELPQDEFDRLRRCRRRIRQMLLMVRRVCKGQPLHHEAR